MKTKRLYARGSEFPNEGFVQSAIAAHFNARGFIFRKHEYTDLVATDSDSGLTWFVEVKGDTSDVGLDFKTGLGQIIQRTTNESTILALAVPKTRKFMAQCNQVSEFMRKKLNLHWLIVDKDGSVVNVAPGGNLKHNDDLCLLQNENSTERDYLSNKESRG